MYTKWSKFMNVYGKAVLDVSTVKRVASSGVTKVGRSGSLPFCGTFMSTVGYTPV